MYLADGHGSGYRRLCCGHVVRSAYDYVAYTHVEDVAHLPPTIRYRPVG